MTEFFEHPLIKEGEIEKRPYQEHFLSRALNENVLAVLPTGLGKTPIAAMLAAHRMGSDAKGKILVMAPTKPLAAQHLATFRKFMTVVPDAMEVVTGEMEPGERSRMYREKSLVFATPQTILNDIKKGRIDLEPYRLLVVDEAHHAVGSYAYSFISRYYMKKADSPRVLALSASPGATAEKIDEICGNLDVHIVEIKTEKDADVKPYVKDKETEIEYVALPKSFIGIKEALEKIYQRKLDTVIKFGLKKPKDIVNKRDLLGFQKALFERVSGGDRTAFTGVSAVTQCIKLDHALTLLETQGIRPLHEYFVKLRDDKTKAGKLLSSSYEIIVIAKKVGEMMDKGSKHPKISKLCSIVEQELSKTPEMRIIVFANYRSSVDEIAKTLEHVGKARPVRFIGQKEGYTQKQQIETIRKFREGEYNVLVCTSVGEEGLDIPSANLAIFYEPVPSPLRSIQRRGRVGRMDVGKVIMLITAGTRDEGYYWSAYHKERKMENILRGMGSKA